MSSTAVICPRAVGPRLHSTIPLDLAGVPPRVLIVLAILAAPGAALAEDWPEWRGPRRDGVSVEKDWLAGWRKGETPRVLWRAAVGKGHSAVSVAGGRAYTMGWDGSQDSIHCFDAALGQLLWRRSYACGTIAQWPGPRATPTVAGGKVFTLGQHGQLRSHDAASGAQAWAVDLPASYKPDADYGFPWSPLVEGDHLILGAGSGGLALRAADGAFAWGNDGKPGACASPVRSEHEGRRAVALIANDGGKSVHLLGVDPASGAELWRSEPWPERWGAACVDPLVAGASIFLTTAEQQNGGVRYTIRGSRLTRDWMDRGLACYTGGCVLVGGHLFAVTKAGILKCVEWESGKEKWSRRGFDGHGALIAAGGFLIVQTSEQGDVVVVKADARGHEEVRRTRVFAGEPRTFTAPVLANGRLYCRSYAGEVVCLQVGETAAQRSSGISPDLGSEGGHR